MFKYLILSSSIVLFGCASTAPPDFVEDSTESMNPVGRVVEVRKVTPTHVLSSSGTAAAAAAGGVVGLLIGTALDQQAATRTMHTIQLASGETVRQSSAYEFPVGTCVSVGSINSDGRLLSRSQRCN
jgi:hypothetical protein